MARSDGPRSRKKLTKGTREAAEVAPIASGSWELKRLELGSTGVSHAALPLLKKFTQLEWLGLHGTRVDKRGIKALRKVLPGGII